jgi:hypothetical protein|tara:strand:+ start:55 stop:237 length:183 start_codon:yes stop_codon:yes gene_type:complete
MTFIFILIKPLLLMAVRKVFKKQMKTFAVEMLEEYAKTTDNDVDDQLVARVKKAMRLGAV